MSLRPRLGDKNPCLLQSVDPGVRAECRNSHCTKKPDLCWGKIQVNPFLASFHCHIQHKTQNSFLNCIIHIQALHGLALLCTRHHFWALVVNSGSLIWASIWFHSVPFLTKYPAVKAFYLSNRGVINSDRLHVNFALASITIGLWCTQLAPLNNKTESNKPISECVIKVL